MFRIKQLNQFGFDHLIVAVITIVGVSIVGAALIVAGHAATAFQWKGTLEMNGSNSGYCLTGNGASTSSKVTLYSCTTSNNDQQWSLYDVATATVMGVSNVQEFYLQNGSGTNECLNNPYGSKSNGTATQLYPCKSTDHASLWVWGTKFTAQKLSSHQLINVASISGTNSKCLDDAYGSTGSGTKVQTWSCKTSGQANQSWLEGSAPSTSSTGTGGTYWGIAAAGTALPRSDSYCSANVQQFSERIAANATANATEPPIGTNFDWGQWAHGTTGLTTNFSHVDGRFSGTTDEILEWAACKWGWDQNYAKAEAIVESSWNQSVVGDNDESFGILQVRAVPSGSPSANTGWGGYPWTQKSTALNADAQMAFLRACYDGSLTYLDNGYKSGDAWGCIGAWNSGKWKDAQATSYIAKVQSALNNQQWLKLR